MKKFDLFLTDTDGRPRIRVGNKLDIQSYTHIHNNLYEVISCEAIRDMKNKSIVFDNIQWYDLDNNKLDNFRSIKLKLNDYFYNYTTTLFHTHIIKDSFYKCCTTFKEFIIECQFANIS